MSTTATQTWAEEVTVERVQAVREALDAAGVAWKGCGGRVTAEVRQQATAVVLSAAEVGIRVTKIAARLQTHRPTVYDMLKAEGQGTAATSTRMVVRQQKLNRVRLAREARDVADAVLTAAIEEARAVGVSPEDIGPAAGVAARTLRDRAQRTRAEA